MPIGPFTKTVQNVIDRVTRQFGDESGAQVTNADIISWINSGQQEINRQQRILKDIAVTPTIIGTSGYAFPTPKILQIETLQYKGKPLDQMSFNAFQEYIQVSDPEATQTGTPLYWYEWGTNINLYPIPDAVENLTLYYVKYPDDIANVSDTLTIPDNYYDALLQYCLQQAYEQDDDWTGSAQKQQQLKEQLSALSEDGNRFGRQYYPTITILDEEADTWGYWPNG